MDHLNSPYSVTIRANLQNYPAIPVVTMVATLLVLNNMCLTTRLEALGPLVYPNIFVGTTQIADLSPGLTDSGMVILVSAVQEFTQFKTRIGRQLQ